MRHGQRAHDGFALGLSGEHDARGGREIALDLAKQFGAVHARHAHVGDDHVGRRLLHVVERLLPAERERHFPPLALLAQ